MPLISIPVLLNFSPDDDVQVLGPYYPYRGGSNSKFDDRSRQLLALKNGAPQAIRFFVEQVRPFVPNQGAITVIPSHDPSQRASGILQMAQQLATPTCRDATGCLIRHTFKPKLSHGGDRNIEGHLATIRVEHSEIIQGQHVLLLDDITTTGNSFRACKQLLLEAGAAMVQCVALGQTTND